MRFKEAWAFVQESNRIEGIHRDATTEELKAYYDFLDLPEITVADLENFVQVMQPGAVLRDKYGLDVRVGMHTPLAGSPYVKETLQNILNLINQSDLIPFSAHIQYEVLHPFTDGNGRSGRMLWKWHMDNVGLPSHLGFLHTFYYQVLQGE